MNPSSLADIKKAQKESVLFRNIAEFFHQPLLDNPVLKDLMVNRVSLSPDRRACTIFFYTPKGRDHFTDISPELNSYKAALRKTLAKQIKFRLTPELVFQFDKQFEKQCRIEELLEKVKQQERAREAEAEKE